MALTLAKLSCAWDTDCIAIVDGNCDGQSPFQLCSKTDLGKRDNLTTCNSGQKKEGNVFTFGNILYYLTLFYKTCNSL